MWPTGEKWGRKIADVEVTGIPKFLVGQVMLIPADEERDSYMTDEVRLVIYRCDQYDHQGWNEPFAVVLAFPDGSKCEVEVPPSFSLIDGHSLRIPVASPVSERPVSQERKIPRIVFNLSQPITKQDSQEVRRSLKNVRKITNFLQCNALYLVLEDDACQREVENSGVSNFAEAYAALQVGSYRTHLMRYYLLYKYGGVYFDDKTLIRESLDSPIFDSIFTGVGGVPCDFFISSHRTPDIAFMAARRGCPIMLKALESAIANIMKREYTNHRLGITGDNMFATTITQGVPGDGIWIRYGGEMCAILPIIRSNNGGVMLRKHYLWQREAIIPTVDSSSLWSQRQVFVDGNPTLSTWDEIATSPWVNTVIFILSAFAGLALIAFIISRYPPIEWI